MRERTEENFETRLLKIEESDMPRRLNVLSDECNSRISILEESDTTARLNVLSREFNSRTLRLEEFNSRILRLEDMNINARFLQLEETGRQTATCFKRQKKINFLLSLILISGIIFNLVWVFPLS